MRTTLKRGVGRSSGANGNGRAVLPPEVAPPAVPIVRYRQPPPPQRGAGHLVAKALVWLLIGAVTVAAGLLGGAYLYFTESVDDVVAHTPEVVIAQEQLDIVPPGDPAIALVVGYDRRAGAEGDVNGARSDTVMLVRADPDKRALSMLSFPRDLVVDIHCPETPPFRQRINEAYSTCGPQGSLETVRQLTGLPINYLVTVNFHGFKQIVANLGGVWMDVDRRYFNDNTHGGERYATIDLRPGYQKLNGQEALDFVRYRHYDSDLYRLARQQMFVQSFKQAVTTSFKATSIPKIVRVVTDNVEVGVKGGEFSPREFLSWGLFAFDLPKGNFFQTRIDHACFSGDAELHVADECIQKAVQEFANPDVEAAEKATAVAIGAKPKTAVPPPADTTLVVLNGNGIAGAAADTSYQLAQRGYKTVAPPDGQIANAPTQSYVTSKVYYDALQEGAEPAAEKLATILGTPETVDVEPVPAEIEPLRGGAMLVAVIGQSYAGSVVAAPVDQTPEPNEPEVTENPDLTAGLLREAQADLPFPVLVPRVIERNSRLDHEAPVRVYDMAGHPTLRLTFLTGAAEYWGIQMVRWNRAPAIRQPNRKLHMDGRVYELHYNGPRLHMVVVRAQGTTYWVVNTLLNTLSNETLLAVARGLEPLPPASG